VGRAFECSCTDGQNPRKTVPAAIRKTFYRILFFYIIGVLVVGMIVDSSS